MGAKNVNMIRVNKGQQKKLKPAVVSIVHTSANSFRIIFILVKSRRLALWNKKKIQISTLLFLFRKLQHDYIDPTLADQQNPITVLLGN